MSYGIDGSTLNDELNRLANGGTYPPLQDYKDQAGAAQAWAAAESVNLGKVSDLVGVLNYINGVTDRTQMLDIAGVCNSIAGTTGLEPAAALRQVTGFVPYPPVVNSNSINFYTGWTPWNANQPPDWGVPGAYLYSDGTLLKQNETKTVQGSSVPDSYVDANANLIVQPNGYFTPRFAPMSTFQSTFGITYASTVNIVPNYTCPNGGTYNPATGLCEQ